MPSTSDKFLHWAGISAWAIFILLMLSDVVQAAPPHEFEDPARLQAIATRYAQDQTGGGRTQATASLPDSRLRLPRCPEEPKAYARSTGLRMQVQLNCPGLWKIYVPVSVQQQKLLVVASRSLNAHEVVSASDLSLEWRNVQGVHYANFEQIEAVAGREVSHPIQAGQLVQANQLRQAASIRKGDTVTLLSKVGSVEIRGRGIAQNDAVENTRVQVKNLSSGRLVEGYARSGGVVEIRG